MKTIKIALSAAFAGLLLSGCNTLQTGANGTASAGINTCQVAHTAINSVDQTLPSVKMWEGLLRSVAASSDFSYPAIPSMNTNARDYYQAGLLVLNTTLMVQGCPSSTLSNMLANDMNNG